ncbi:MAG: hypothetical protein Kow00120_19980 [Anaerolineae bacterium]
MDEATRAIPDRPRAAGGAFRLLVVLFVLYFSLFGGGASTQTNFWPYVLHQIVTTALLAAWLIALWRGRRGFPRTPLDRPLLVFGLALIVSALASAHPRVSLAQTWTQFVHILGFYLLVDLMQRGWQRWVFAGLFLAGAVVAASSAVEATRWFFGLPPFVQSWPAVGAGLLPPVLRRVGWAMNNANLLAGLVAVLMPVTAMWAATARSRARRWLLWALVAGLAATLALTQSRGGWLSGATGAAVLVAFWALRQAGLTRWRRETRPRTLALAAALAVPVIAAGVFLLARTFAMRTTGDTARLDLWRSAVEMARDHPVLGVGPSMYSAAVRAYREPALVLDVDWLHKAHNLPLHVAAELGLVGVAVLAWLAVAVLRAWWARWRAAGAAQRRRLEGCLAAGVGFGVHSMFDLFEFTPVVLPLLVCGAYVVAAGGRAGARDRRWAVPALALLTAYAAAFAPIDAAMFNLGRSAAHLDAGALEAALEAAEQAQAIDPALDLYQAHAAYVLGRLAAGAPAAYLDRAIAAHEAVVAARPTFDVGYANLGALYAQQGDWPAAVAALERACALYPREPAYWLALGRYREAAGARAGALDAYAQALRENPTLADPRFWAESGAGVAHQAVVEAAMRGVDAADAIDLALAAGDLDAAAALLAAGGVPDEATGRYYQAVGDHDRALAWFDSAIARQPGRWQGYYYRAESAVAVGEWEEAARDARTVLFINPTQGARARYILAQVAINAGDWDQAEALLAASVPARNVAQNFAVASYGSIFGMLARFDHLPQLRAPGLGAYTYAPWLDLAARYEDTGRRDEAAALYETIARLDPYLAEAMAARLAAHDG